MGLTSLLPSLTLALLVFGIAAVFSDPSEEDRPQFRGTATTLFFSIVVFSPVVETLLMMPVLWALSHAAQKPMLLAILSAAVWAALHSLLAPAWGLVIAWPFYVFSRAYLAWRPYGWWKAVGVTACIHAFQNLFGVLAMAFLDAK
jgi:hypothetical protein